MTSSPIESDHGYLSAESKRRFTLVAGVLGAVFFLAQLLLPMLLVFLIMVPMIFRTDFSDIDVDQAALWRDELWLIERTTRPDWRDPEASPAALALARVRLADLAQAGPAIPLDTETTDETLALLPIGDRLWVIGRDAVSYYDGRSLTRLGGAGRPTRASTPFVYDGRPAVISLGTPPMLATLEAEGSLARWTERELPLGLPPEAGSLRALRAVEAGERLYLFAQLCTDTPEYCSLRYREADQATWLPVVDDDSSRATWTAIVSGSRPAVVLVERQAGREEERVNRLTVVTIAADGPRQTPIETEGDWLIGRSWRPLSWGSRLVLVWEGIAGSLNLAEVADGRVSRVAKRPSPFPLGSNMLLFMLIPQLLPLLLSLILAFILTVQMRRHRTQDYVFAGRNRAFASLWQRALAQLVDLVPLGAAFLLPIAWMWRVFSDPENVVAKGPWFGVYIFGLVVVALLCGLLVLLAFSYLEGRFGKTPGKWLLGIRVLGTDLQPCGFWRALLRNLLTFVDGFFNFLVGALLVALTDNWQRLGDLAARTIVVVDEKPA